jgi:very-short-patch-repair endonuclease
VAAAKLWLGDRWVVGLRSAARLWSFDDCRSGALDFVGTRKVNSNRPGVQLHMTKDLPRADRARERGLEATSATRTLLDLGAVLSVAALEVALESALRMGLTSVDYLERRLRHLRRSGRPGIAAMEDVLALRRGMKPTESALETKLFQVLRAGKLPLPDRQIPVYGEDGVFIARPDFLYPRRRFAIEAFSRRHHGGWIDVDADRLRRNRLMVAGYRVLEITHQEISRTPGLVVAQVADGLGMSLF